MPPSAVKFAPGADDALELLAIPFGGPIAGKDTDGEYFSPRTDLCLDWYPAECPLLYEHGLDGGPGVSVIGRVDRSSARKEPDGWWVRAQLDKAHRYYESIKELIGQGKLYGSSGAMPHLVQTSRGGEITRWPWVEQSLTPAPANLFARVEPAAVEKHYKSAGLDLKATWTAAMVNDLPDSAFLYIEPGGKKDDEGKTTPRSLRHFPYKGPDGKVDVPHLRNALARIPQSDLPADVKGKVLDKARQLAKDNGIDAGDDEGSKAAKETAHTAPRNHYHEHEDGTGHSHAHEHPDGVGDHDGDAGQHRYGGRGKGASAKAVPAGAIPAEGYHGDPPEGSLEDWIDDLSERLNGGMFGPSPFEALPFIAVVATFGCNGPGYCIVHTHDDDDECDYYRVEFDVDAAGEPVLGAVSPLEKIYIAADEGEMKRLNAVPLALAAHSLTRRAAALGARTKDVLGRRIKEGRVLSGANVQRLQALQQALEESAREIASLLDSAQPPAKAADPALLRILDLRTRQSRLHILE